ncbi:MAG: hypothetical protein JWN34_2533 [Bryobacterales bacterium]|nr:hypothetical protein [Bryobacterales bacterium]
MLAPAQPNLTFDYAIVRVVPRVERGEFVNAGVILFCLSRKLLLSKFAVDEAKLRALSPTIDIDSVHQHLAALQRICAGDPDAGPVAQLSVRERFHWLVAPRSTMIQTSPVHSGLCDSPEHALLRLFQSLVE